MKDIIVLGSTGSIGKQALEVAKRGEYRVRALAAGKDIETLEIQARRFRPQMVAVFDDEAAKSLEIKLGDTDIKVVSGENGVCEAAAAEGDIALNAIVGIAGLSPTMAAIESGKDIALANKETLVTAGSLVNEAARKKGIKIIPVDSEHSAIFQSLEGAPHGALKKIILTASGGPFYGKTRRELEDVTVGQALRHPNWSMGAKITIDSATLMNKGLEIIEAVHLFGLPAEDIEVLVHRQSILHSAAEFCDGAVIAQLGTPDMRLPIQYALTYPERAPHCFERLSLSDIGTLTFEKPDTKTFKGISLCTRAIGRGPLVPAAVNGANEQAVELFLKGRIKFLEIYDLVGEALEKANGSINPALNDVFEADKQARLLVRSLVN